MAAVFRLPFFAPALLELRVFFVLGLRLVPFLLRLLRAALERLLLPLEARLLFAAFGLLLVPFVLRLLFAALEPLLVPAVLRLLFGLELLLVPLELRLVLALAPRLAAALERGLLCALVLRRERPPEEALAVRLLPPAEAFPLLPPGRFVPPPLDRDRLVPLDA